MRAPFGVDEARGPWVATFTGRRFYYLTPEPGDVCIEDIAHSLACQARFLGHTIEPSSVAEHCVRVSWLCSEEHALTGQLHDATEYVLADVPKPLKPLLPEYSTLERVVAAAIGLKFGVNLVNLPLEVKLADSVMLATEARDRMNPMLDGSEWWREKATPQEEKLPAPWDWKFAERAFLITFEHLRKAAA